MIRDEGIAIPGDIYFSLIGVLHPLLAGCAASFVFLFVGWMSYGVVRTGTVSVSVPVVTLPRYSYFSVLLSTEEGLTPKWDYAAPVLIFGMNVSLAVQVLCTVDGTWRGATTDWRTDGRRSHWRHFSKRRRTKMRMWIFIMKERDDNRRSRSSYLQLDNYDRGM